MENYRLEQKVLQEKDLAGVGIQKYDNNTHEQFEFSVDDVIEKYSDFLNPDLSQSHFSATESEADNESSSEANVG